MKRKTTPTSLAAVVLAATLARAVTFAQTGREELVEELRALREGQEQIREEIGEILAGLRPKPAPATVGPAKPDVAGRVFDLGANPIEGERTAKLTLVEFTDYQ